MNHTHWIEINAQALIHNLHILRSHLAHHVKILAVVKADAYGLGMTPVARLFQEQGVEMLGVTNVEEGVTLRQQGITLPILLFAPLLPQESPIAITNQLTPTVNSVATLATLAENLTNKEPKFPIHLKVETGMGRTGLKPEEVPAFCRLVANDYPHLQVEGIYSHFAKAGKNENQAKKQFQIFEKLLEELKDEGIEIPLKHMANSTATLEMPATHLDMVRLGTVLYGQHPANTQMRMPLENPWQAKARILHIQELPAGSPVGYGGDYITKRATRIGVIPVGYADGLGVSPVARPKNLWDLSKTLVKTILAYWNRGPQALQVSYEGQQFPFVGRLGMQLSMIDLREHPIEAGAIVQVPLGRITANPNLPRIYLGQEERAFMRK